MRSQRGFTMVEVLVSVVASAFVTMAILAFAQAQIRSRKVVQLRLETEQNARVAMDSIRNDLQQAGLGAGYDMNGVFFGLVMGNFGPFQSADFDHGGGITSDDFRVRGSLGPVRTITSDPNAADNIVQVCAQGGFQNGDVVLMLDESYSHARAVEVTSVIPTACVDGDCIGVGGCENLQFTDKSSVFLLDAQSLNVSYAGGSAFRGYFDVVYFIDRTTPSPSLYRADWPCGAVDPPPNRATCATPANLLAEGVEALEIRIFEMDDAGVVTDQTANAAYLLAGGPQTDNRLRVEAELITRSRSEENEITENQMCSSINPAMCFPGVATRDHFVRRSVHTSAELKNSSLMRFDPAR